MAKNKTSDELTLRIRLLQKLTLAPEARNEPPKGAYPAGRIKKFFDLFRANYSNLTVINALSLLFALPMLAIIGYIMALGFENFTYLLEKMTTPYLMSDFGIGLSVGQSLSQVQVSMLISYRVLILGVAITLPIFSFGLAGVYHIVTKLSWGEDFISKKDKYGNNVPRMALEFFRGVKLFWKEMLVITAIFAIILAGAGNLIITFIEGFWQNKAGAGHYIALIVGMLVLIISALIMVNLMPLVVSYKIKFRDKLKNAVILTTVFIVPTMFIVISIIVPFLLAMLGSFIGIIVTLAFIMLGVSFYSLMFANYADYNSEKILVPLYEMSIQPKTKKTGKSKKDAKNSASKNKK